MGSDKTVVLQNLFEVAREGGSSASPGSAASESVSAIQPSPAKSVNPPSRGRKFEALLARISPENLHGRIDFGAPAGRELL